MPKLTIDGMNIEVPAGTTLLQAAQQLGIYIPRYCYHPKLSVAGNCRMCLVEIEKSPKLVTACSTEAAEGMAVSTAGEKVKKARRDVLEYLLINHPLDCPICDQAGECGLQDYYMEHSLQKSRFAADDKVLRQKRRAVGPHLILDNERCILCTRCVRFCAEVTKTAELEVMERADHSFIDLKEGRALDNGYSLNIADLCPVGAFTSRDFRFKQRVWFLKKTPTICLGCATGCQIEAQHNRNAVYRLVPRPNAETNTWLCDYGRMTYKAVQAGDRLEKAMIRRGLIDIEPALREAATRLDEFKGAAAVLGSPWLSVEDNAALARLARESLKTAAYCFDHTAEQGIKDGILINKDPAPNTAGLKKVKAAAGGLSLEEFTALLAGGKVKVLVAEAKAYGLVKAAAAAAGVRLVIFALNRGDAPASAHALLPYASYFETPGTFINYQGLRRATAPAVEPPQGVKPLWAVVNKLASYSGAELHLDSPAAALKDINF
ncbi:MAG TPA: 2Fe-2S iron-sulfur cluster-binding protein [Elusimicrobiales bacterium]|nr:2Fe-2S iron-sulfur cluster-binding protein [Elusimicrobiales bacterium]